MPTSTTSTHLNEKVNTRGSSFLAAIDKHCEWISFATKEHPTTANARKIVREINRLANANGPCKMRGCQCYSAMAQSNICVDNNGSQNFRAELTKGVNCQSSSVVYLIRCRKSGKKHTHWSNQTRAS